MADESKRSAEYRRSGDEIRKIARMTTDASIREQLLLLARQWDDLAAQAEGKSDGQYARDKKETT